ncbi:hypothetical protein EG327_006957 [Venturia inaequalis]|uniref:F-box domain-containing protein n=1 Tax=Venturia inaequalis TaxID=5025 RepID=A0A8H3VU71_VENIN|nr:hypothetical protein EG327_006957 [Venturia inaequalis]
MSYQSYSVQVRLNLRTSLPTTRKVTTLQHYEKLTTSLYCRENSTDAECLTEHASQPDYGSDKYQTFEVKKNTMVSIPTELIEKITAFLSPKDLRAVRLTNSILAKRSFRHFADRHFNSITWTHARHSPTHWAKTGQHYLAERPECAPYVRTVSIQFATNPWKIANLPSPDYYVGNLMLFYNIHNLRLTNCSPHLMSDGFEEFTWDLYLPHLETLLISDARSFGKNSVTRFITAMMMKHQRTLKTIELLHIVTEHIGDWPHILEVANCLSDNASIHICGPMVRRNHSYVSFIPPSSVPDYDSVCSLQGPVATLGGHYRLTFHHFSRPGKLKAALRCMARSYRVAQSWEEALLFNGDLAPTDPQYLAALEAWAAWNNWGSKKLQGKHNE